MPLIIEKPREGQLRAAHEQIRAERNQHALTEAQLRQENAMLSSELARVRYALAQRDTRDAFAAVPSPSSMPGRPPFAAQMAQLINDQRVRADR